MDYFGAAKVKVQGSKVSLNNRAFKWIILHKNDLFIFFLLEIQSMMKGNKIIVTFDCFLSMKG
jgi:hypothetical protein